MRILNYLFLAILIFALAAFAAANWVMVTVKLLPSYELVIRLPVLLFAVALLGAMPASIAHSIGRWTWRRRLTRTERELQSTRTAVVEPEVKAPTAFDAMPPQAQPLVVPPAGA